MMAPTRTNPHQPLASGDHEYPRGFPAFWDALKHFLFLAALVSALVGAVFYGSVAQF